MGGKVPVSEAVIAMISMTIVLVIVLIIFCFVPAYKVWKKRREQLANFWETDPRWNSERFCFTPRLPDDYQNDKKYSRLACSRSSSVKSGGTEVVSINGQNVAVPTSAQVDVHARPVRLASISHSHPVNVGPSSSIAQLLDSSSSSLEDDSATTTTTTSGNGSGSNLTTSSSVLLSSKASSFDKNDDKTTFVKPELKTVDETKPVVVKNKVVKPQPVKKVENPPVKKVEPAPVKKVENPPVKKVENPPVKKVENPPVKKQPPLPPPKISVTKAQTKDNNEQQRPKTKAEGQQPQSKVNTSSENNKSSNSKTANSANKSNVKPVAAKANAPNKGSSTGAKPKAKSGGGNSLKAQIAAAEAKKTKK